MKIHYGGGGGGVKQNFKHFDQKSLELVFRPVIHKKRTLLYFRGQHKFTELAFSSLRIFGGTNAKKQHFRTSITVQLHSFGEIFIWKRVYNLQSNYNYTRKIRQICSGVILCT